MRASLEPYSATNQTSGRKRPRRIGHECNRVATPIISRDKSTVGGCLFAFQCGVVPLIRVKSVKIENNTKKAPATRKIIVIILVFRFLHSGVGGGLKLG